MPALLAILIGLLLGRTVGGSVASLSAVELRFPYAVLAAFVVQGLARGRIGAGGLALWGMLLWGAVSLVLVVLLAMQPRNTMLAVVGLGISLNLLVVLLNGYMPVYPPTETAAGALASSSLSSDFYALGNSGTIAPVLADCVALPAFGHTYMFSLGDLLLVTGAAAFIAEGMSSALDIGTRQS